MMYEEQIGEKQDPMRKMMMKKKKNANEFQKKLRKSSSVKEKFASGKVVIMDLSGLSLESLPNPSLNLASVSKLDLSNNNLQNIPESLIARLLNLIVLDVHSNQLKSLPNSIGCLSKLKILNVSGNLLQSLPKTIEDCKSLEELNANFNELSKLPDAIGFELTNLKKLSVNSNKLNFLPYSTSHLTSLRILDARLNSLISLPQDMENLTNLQVLNVSQNFRTLSTLPYSIGLLISLVELDVSYNDISVLPDSIGCLRNLEKLSVEGNPLVSPPMELVEQGVQAVKEYLSEKMTEGYNSPTKKKSWAIGNFVKCGTPKPRKNRQGGGGGGGFFSLSDYRQIQGLLSPRHLAMLSPRRLFSPRSRPSVG